MLRLTIVYLLSAGAAAGCANLTTAANTGYCLDSSNMGCSELEGQGDCQPCPASAMTGGNRRLSENTLEQRLP
jgi:hypothetical protein